MKKFALLIVIVCSLALLSFPASADSFMAPVPFETTYPNGDKVFRFDPKDNDGPAEAAVYTTTEPRELVYSVENLSSFAYYRDFYFSPDMMSFAYIPMADKNTAIKFYSNGILKKEYKIDDLVRNMSKVSYSVSTALWSDSVPVSNGNILTITTVDNMTYDFDISAGGAIVKTTGNSYDIMSILMTWMWWIISAIVLAIGGVVLLIVLLRRRRS